MIICPQAAASLQYLGASRRIYFCRCFGQGRVPAGRVNIIIDTPRRCADRKIDAIMMPLGLTRNAVRVPAAMRDAFAGARAADVQLLSASILRAHIMMRCWGR